MKFVCFMMKGSVKKKEEIQIEIEEELLNKLNEIIKPLGMTPEWLAEQFIRFCADSKNTEALRKMLDEWKTHENTQLG